MPAAPTETRAFSSLKDLLALATEKRDIKLKSDLESLVRPIRVAPGQFEMALEPGAHPGLPGEIARKLEAFTGLRWMVMVAKDGGDKPVSRQRQESQGQPVPHGARAPGRAGGAEAFPRRGDHRRQGAR